MDQTETIEPKRGILIPFEMAVELRDALNRAHDWGEEIKVLYAKAIPAFRFAQFAASHSIFGSQTRMKALEIGLIRMGAIETDEHDDAFECAQCNACCQ